MKEISFTRRETDRGRETGRKKCGILERKKKRLKEGLEMRERF